MNNKNKFYNDKKYQIECFSDSDKIKETYRIGDKVPMSCIGLKFDTIWSYAQSYNIFPYKSEDYVLLIRNGIFRDAIHYTELKDDYIFGVNCYDIYGNKLEVKYVNDYIKLKKEQ